MLEIEVCEVRGPCPVYKVGDKITINDPRIVLEKTRAFHSPDIARAVSRVTERMHEKDSR